MNLLDALVDISLVCLALMAVLSIYYGATRKLPFLKRNRPSFDQEKPDPPGGYKQPYLTFERIFTRERGKKLRIQLLLKSSGSLLTLHKVKSLEESDLLVDYLPLDEMNPSGPDEYPRGTSITFFLTGKDLNPRKDPYYDMQVTFSDHKGKLYTQRISGLFTYTPIIDPPEKAPELSVNQL